VFSNRGTMADKKPKIKIDDDISLSEDVNLTFYLIATGRANRLKKTVYIESVYYDILKERNIIISDLVNYLLEKYLREVGYLDIKQYLK
jgi:hypothetical protein